MRAITKVRANYNDYKNNIYSTLEYLNRFFGNLLLGERNTLRNRDLRVLSEIEMIVLANVPGGCQGDGVRGTGV